MKRQTRPFVVEVKSKRSASKGGRSIWGDLDLSSITAEATKEQEGLEASSRSVVDSGLPSIDTKDEAKLIAEENMANLAETAPVQSSNETPARADAKKKISQPRKPKSQSKLASAKDVTKAAVLEKAPPAPAKARRKAHSENERSQKLDHIASSIAAGESVKNAAKQAGISEQTYYQWKKISAPQSETGDLKDLIALEEENARLKKLLAERLRKENAELKRKLGLD